MDPNANHFDFFYMLYSIDNNDNLLHAHTTNMRTSIEETW
jgi:hypothetical protein